MPDARSDASAPVRHVVVVGGGIAGLAAAWTLHEEAGSGGPPLRVTVLEATGQVGGKLREVSREELTREAQKGFASRENFEKAAKLTQKNQACLSAAK